MLRVVDYELNRAVTRKGEINSGIRGGRIRVVIDGFADSLLLAWLFNAFRKEDGSIVTLDENERSVEKLRFANASATSFRMNYDSRTKCGVTVMMIIEAKEIITDNDLHFECK
ncbi:MAG: type VI secretion system tube protein TssD [Bacteroidales bacterium]